MLICSNGNRAFAIADHSLTAKTNFALLQNMTPFFLFPPPMPTLQNTSFFLHIASVLPKNFCAEFIPAKKTVAA